VSICVSQLQIIISIVKDVVTFISLSVGTYVAVRGLETWRRQLRGTAEYEAGRRTLRALFRLKNAVKAVRNSLIWPREEVAAMKEKGVEMSSRDPKSHVEGLWAVYELRWQRVIEALSELEVEAIEAEILWDSDVRDPLEEIKRSVSSLFGALNVYIRHLYEPGEELLSLDKYKDVPAIVIASESDDEFDTVFQGQISRLEELIRSKISIGSQKQHG
jgi:hypothetical protein